MPGKTGLWGVLRVLDESPKQLSDDERPPKGLTSAVGQISVPSRADASVGAPQPTGGTSSEPSQRPVRTLNATDFITDRENEEPRAPRVPEGAL